MIAYLLTRVGLVNTTWAPSRAGHVRCTHRRKKVQSEQKQNLQANNRASLSVAPGYCALQRPRMNLAGAARYVATSRPHMPHGIYLRRTSTANLHWWCRHLRPTASEKNQRVAGTHNFGILTPEDLVAAYILHLCHRHQLLDIASRAARYAINEQGYMCENYQIHAMRGGYY